MATDLNNTASRSPANGVEEQPAATLWRGFAKTVSVALALVYVFPACMFLVLGFIGLDGHLADDAGLDSNRSVGWQFLFTACSIFGLLFAWSSFGSTPRRRWRFSLADLMITVTVVAVGFGLFSLVKHAQPLVDPIFLGIWLAGAAGCTLAAILGHRQSKVLRILCGSVAILCALALVRLCLTVYPI